MCRIDLCGQIGVWAQKWPDLPANMYMEILEDEKYNAHN